jgi:hypothetical protein
MKDIIGIDSVKFYDRENYYYHIREILPLIKLGKSNNYLYKHHNNVKIIFSFLHGMTTISFSVPKLIYGNNFKLAGRKELHQAITIVSNLIKLDIKQFYISRTDITSDFKSQFTAIQHSSLICNPSRFKGKNEWESGYYYHIHKDFKLSTRVVLVYQKQDKVRFEVKIMSCKGVKTTASSHIKRFFKHEPQVSELLKEDFYRNCIKHYVQVVGSTLKGKKLKSVETEVRDQIYASLRDNYYNSFNQSYW